MSGKQFIPWLDALFGGRPLIWIYTICPDLSVPFLMIIKVIELLMSLQVLDKLYRCHYGVERFAGVLEQ